MDYAELRKLATEEISDLVKEKRHESARAVLYFFGTCANRFGEYTTLHFDEMNRYIIDSLLAHLGQYDRVEYNKKILVIDIETTGFMKEGGAIVEVGMVSLDLASGAVETVFDSVCREEFITAKHREEPMGWIFRNSTLTVDDVRKAPLLSTLLPAIQNIIDSHPCGATAYNRSFDFDFLESRGVQFGVQLPCPMKLATPICRLPPNKKRGGEYKWPSVEEAWNHFFPGDAYVELHRGADDARHEARIVYELYKRGCFAIKEGEIHDSQ